MQDKTIVLHTLGDTVETTLAQHKLKTSGIDSFPDNEKSIGLNPSGGTELKIFSSDKEKAEKIIVK